ncbi:MAG: transketolase, partial [Defluviitaleaceae bacterium]|nr:transketolase [Defluviitaleaceae bacterium]
MVSQKFWRAAYRGQAARDNSWTCPKHGLAAMGNVENDNPKNDNLTKISQALRLTVLDMITAAKSGHIGGSMSCMDILVALYYIVMDTEKIRTAAADRERFILSKGHCAEALYAVLADKGFIPKETLKTYAAFDTILAEHPTAKINGVEIATGALGHGLSVGVGMAIAVPSSVYVLLGDGELAEGSIWEAAMTAAKYRLTNLTAIIDRNRLQISGSTEEVMPLENLAEKFRSFGWDCRPCNGHSPKEIAAAITENRPPNKPMAIIANTVKGYGSAVMANLADWHHNIPNNAEYLQIKADLEKLAD